MEKELIILIDANNTCFRVGWANKHLTNGGEPTGVIYGFLREILGIWERWKHARIAVIWDSSSEFRKTLTKEAILKGIISEDQGYYKQNRERQRAKDEEAGKINEIAEAIEIQKPTLKKILDLTLVRQIKEDGYEADDLIGTFAKVHSDMGNIVKIVSSDKDMYQLLSPNVEIFTLGGKHSMTYDHFVGEYGISPAQWIDIGALAGDKGDNIHGVPGIAEKTAIKFLTATEDALEKERGTTTYQDVIEFIKNKEEKKRKKKEQNVIDNEEVVHLAYKLKKIMTDINCSVDLTYNKSNPRDLKGMLDALGFRSIISSTGLLTRRAWT
jgi:DNA polymerase-1